MKNLLKGGENKMETGQLLMMQMPDIATSSAAMEALAPTRLVSGEKSGDSIFAAFLNSAMPVTLMENEPITTDKVSQAIQQVADDAMLLTGRTLPVLHEAGLTEAKNLDLKTESAEQLPAKVPQEVADMSGALVVQALHNSGRMPETEQSVSEQVLETDSDSVAAETRIQQAEIWNSKTNDTKFAEATATVKVVAKESDAMNFGKSMKDIPKPVATGIEIAAVNMEKNLQKQFAADVELTAETANPINVEKNLQKPIAAGVELTTETAIPFNVEKILQKPIASGLELTAETADGVKTRMEPAMPAVVRHEIDSTNEDDKATLSIAKQEQVATSSETRQPYSAKLPDTLPQTATRDSAKFQQASVQQIMEAYSQPAATKPVPTAEDSPATPVDTVPRTVSRAVETGATQLQLAVKVNEPQREERILQQPSSDSTGKVTENSQNLLNSAVKEPASVPQEDASTYGKQLFDQKTTGHVHHAAQQHINTAAPATVDSPPEQAMPSTAAEHVVKQVSERITAHEIKSGSEQIVLRLSPENLGELKVNLKMENLRLTVEIVTENKAVTEALRQNTDSLRETLAKQNIKMDTFDVSTGSNGQDNLAGRNSRNLGEWQEMARNRQANQWLQGGYNIPAVAAADNVTAVASYRSNGLIDGHY